MRMEFYVNRTFHEWTFHERTSRTGEFDVYIVMGFVDSLMGSFTNTYVEYYRQYKLSRDNPEGLR